MKLLKLLFVTIFLISPFISKSQGPDINMYDIVKADIEKENAANLKALKENNIKMQLKPFDEKKYIQDLETKKQKPVKSIDDIIDDTYNDLEKHSEQVNYNTPPPTSDQLIDKALESYKPVQSRDVFAPTVSIHPDENGNYPQEKYAHGALGYDLTKSLDGNEQMYKEAGYTMSYSIKDSTIYGIIIGVVISIILLILGMSVKENNKNKFTAEN